MNLEQRVKMLELSYASVIADAVLRFSNAGILDEVTEQKKKTQLEEGKLLATRMGIYTTKDVFTTLSDLYNCTYWSVSDDNHGVTATANGCRLEANTKKLHTGCPCYIYCLNPMEGLVKAINPDSEFKVISKLWDGDYCKVEVHY